MYLGVWGRDWGCSSVVKHLANMFKAIGCPRFNPSTMGLGSVLKYLPREHFRKISKHIQIKQKQNPNTILCLFVKWHNMHVHVWNIHCFIMNYFPIISLLRLKYYLFLPLNIHKEHSSVIIIVVISLLGAGD